MLENCIVLLNEILRFFAREKKEILAPGDGEFV